MVTKVRYYFYSGTCKVNNNISVNFSGVREVFGDMTVAEIYNQIIVEYDVKYSGTANLVSFNLIGE
jgi:hypothetical protein